jgi:hypothetical protein
MNRQLLQKAIKDLINLHHEAFLLELFGTERVSIPPKRLQEMVEKGVITSEQFGSLRVPLGDGTVDPYEYIRLVSMAITDSGGEKRNEMRGWAMTDWHDLLVEAQQKDREATPTPDITPTILSIPAPSVPDERKPVIPFTVTPPDWMGASDSYAYQQAVTRAGEYCRGLGNIAADTLDNKLGEVWDGEEIEEEVDAAQRAERIKIIQEKTGEALRSHRDEGKLASELGNATNEWGRNWERIARTELQGAYNEGHLLDAIESYGEEARVARVTETNACSHCLRLYRDGEGNPVIFPVEDLMANGTNVGKRPTSWVPTIWPLHPNCRCDTVVVPPGMVVTVDGGLEIAE